MLLVEGKRVQEGGLTILLDWYIITVFGVVGFKWIYSQLYFHDFHENFQKFVVISQTLIFIKHPI